jgi:cold shock protein
MAQEATVKWLNEEKGLSFISPDEGSKDAFIHYSDIGGAGFRFLKEGGR